MSRGHRLKLAAALLALLPVGAARADAQPSTPGAIVALGDSYLSGESGRWAGNTNRSPGNVDALGAAAYFDNATATAEIEKRCHRAGSAPVHVGGVRSFNLACSGAKTASYVNGDGVFKPGLDFYDGGSGLTGQALRLQRIASTERVSTVVIGIGGNNFGFGGIVTDCVTNFLTSIAWRPNYCNDDDSVRRRFAPSAVEANTAAIGAALGNVRQAMAAAGYRDSQWTMLVVTYPSPVPKGSGIRYNQAPLWRQAIGGCGLWNGDADWANDGALTTINGALRSAAMNIKATNVRVLDLSGAFAGRRLCEQGVGLFEDKGLASWNAPGAADRVEWMSQIRILSTVAAPYEMQESLHPNYWGQLAMRNCVRQAAAAYASYVSCNPVGGLNARGEPNMTIG